MRQRLPPGLAGRARLSMLPFVTAFAVLPATACAQSGGAARPDSTILLQSEAPEVVRLTWLSVTNWLVQSGDTRIMLDAYLTRVDRRTLEADGSSTAPATIDEALLARIIDSVIPDRRLDWVLVGQAHWDHAFDAPALATLTGARIGGARSVCHQASALGVPRERCMAVEGGEVIDVTADVRVRVVRWHHSGDSTTENGRRLRAPLELRGPPARDPATGGLRPGYLEDYPSGGGSRGYLITIRTGGRPLALFWTTTGNPQAWDAPVPADSLFLRERGVDLSHLEWATSDQPTRDALAEALRAEGLERVDLWLGFPGATHARQVLPLLRPRTFIPQHWDDFWEPMLHGLSAPFHNPDVERVMSEAGVTLVAPVNYFERFRLDRNGVTRDGDAGARRQLGGP